MRNGVKGLLLVLAFCLILPVNLHPEIADFFYQKKPITLTSFKGYSLQDKTTMLAALDVADLRVKYIATLSVAEKGQMKSLAQSRIVYLKTKGPGLGLNSASIARQTEKYQTLIRELGGSAAAVPEDKGGDTSGSASYLSKVERDVVSEMNLARTRPKEYAEKLKKHLAYYDGNLLRLPGRIPIRTREGKPAVQEAINYLLKVSPVGSLRPSRGMSLAAKDHVRDQASGKTGHYGSDGSSPFQRMNRYGKWNSTAGENIDYGNDTGELIVMALIIDDGVAGRGHRKNIFNRYFRVTGVAAGTHRVYRHMCVITYAGDYAEK